MIIKLPNLNIFLTVTVRTSDSSIRTSFFKKNSFMQLHFRVTSVEGETTLVVHQHDLVSSKTAGEVGFLDLFCKLDNWFAPAGLTNNVPCLATRDGKVSWVLVTNGTFKTFLQLGHWLGHLFVMIWDNIWWLTHVRIKELGNFMNWDDDDTTMLNKLNFWSLNSITSVLLGDHGQCHYLITWLLNLKILHYQIVNLVVLD